MLQFPAPSLADVAWEHLVEGCDEVFPGLLRRFAEPPAVKLPTPMPSHPSAIGCPVDRIEYWTIVGDVDGEERPAIPCGTGNTLHSSNVPLPQCDGVLAAYANS